MTEVPVQRVLALLGLKEVEISQLREENKSLRQTVVELRNELDSVNQESDSE